MPNFDDELKKQLKDPEFKAAFDQEELFANVAICIAKLRRKKHITQADLAHKLHTTQQTISRIESTENESITLKTLSRLAEALGKRVEIRFV